MRLIDADELRPKTFICDEVAEVRSFIEKAPTVDAVPVVHGRCKKSEFMDEWYTYNYTCLECGATMRVCDADYNDIAPNLCPNCGAKLDGGGKDGSE